MHHGMRPRLESYKNKGGNGQRDLEAFGVFLFAREFAAAPLRRGARAQMTDPGEHSQVKDGAGRGEDEHGDADGVLVEAACRSIHSAGRGKGREADRHADAADGENRGAETLEKSEKQARASDGACTFPIRIGIGIRPGIR